MAHAYHKPDWQQAVIALSAAVIAFLIVGLLYQARVIFIPLALAIFLTFVLSPLVSLLQRRGLGRKPAVIVIVIATFLTIGLTMWVVTDQTSGLLTTMARKENADRMTAKVERISGWFSGGRKSDLGRLIDNIEKAVTAPPRERVNDSGAGAVGGGLAVAAGGQLSADVNPLGAAPPAPPVVVTSQGPGWMAQVESYISPLAEVAGQLAFALILLVFMLLKKEDMRNRVLRLIGQGKVTTATKAVDDASRRVSRYLLMQLIINAAFGVVVCLGLYAVGVSYALLWGFIGFLMRYVPYIGTWIGLIPPTVYAFAMTDELWRPVAVVALFLGLEALCNNIFEPWLYGTSLGMSEIAQLVAAAFWSFLWGPIGLILSGPLTTCLLVLGKYVPALKFLDVLLGHEPALEPGVAFFQRLTARDQDEASRIVHEQAAEKDLADVFDGVVMEALALTKTAAVHGELDQDDERYILVTTREIIEDVGDEARRNAGSETPAVADGDRVRILACPAHDETDRVALEMLLTLLGPDKWEADLAAVATLTSELIARVNEFKPAVVCIGSLPPGGLAHTRYLCKRLKSQFPDLKVVVGRWGQQEGADEARHELTRAGVDEVYLTLTETRQQLAAWLPAMKAQQPENGGEDLPDPKTGESREIVGTARA
jgi:predicted PurR-regulated permease PerM